MKDLYKSFVLKILAISFISAFFCLITNTGFSQWMQTGGPQGAEISKVVYNGTNTLYARSPKFIYKSNNNGNSWTIENCPTQSPYNIIVNNSMVFVRDFVSVYRSTDSGTNWDTVTAVGNNLFNTIAFYNDSVYLSINNGIFISPNKGTTWTFISSTLGGGFGNELFFVGNTLYASYTMSNSYVFIKSTDYGRSFTITSNTPSSKTLSAFIYTNGVFYSTFVYDGVYKSTDNCQTWSKVFSTPYLSQIRLKYGNGKLYAYSYDSLFMSPDLGTTWSYINSFSSTLNSIEFIGNKMFAGLYNPGVMSSTNDGYNWIDSYTGMAELWISDLYTFGNYVYASHNGSGICRTTGTGWQQYLGDIPNKHITAMYFDLNSIYAGVSEDLYRSTNNGLNWSILNNGLVATSIVCIYANQGNIYYGTNRYNLFISNDNGVTWRSIVTPLPGITSIANLNEYVFYSTHNTSHAGSGRIYRSSDNGQNWLDVSIPRSPRSQTALLEGHNGNIYAISIKKLHMSTDLGLNWIQFPATFADSNYTCIHSDNGVLYCGTSTTSGKYYLRYSTDNGTTFNQLGDSLPAEVTDITVKENYLYAGLKYYSVWRIDKSFITSVNNETEITPTTFSLKQNYPNPFNPVTKIKYDVARLSSVKIVIYDVTGREVQTLVNESLKPGTYEAAFDGSRLNSGVYFYKLITDGFTETKKMILIK